jgi:hypothetical protein
MHRAQRLALGASLALLVACGNDTDPASSAAGATTGSTGTDGAGGAGGALGLSCEAPFVTKGPWALAFDATSVVVRWEACDAASASGIVVTPEDGGPSFEVESNATPTTLAQTYETPLNPEAPPDYAGTYYLHEAAVAGLSPSTCYRYALVADAARTGRFCTARASGEAFSFAVIGDTNPALGSTSDTISAMLPTNPDFTLHLGDLQYYESLLETWAYWFPKMQPLLAQGAFMPVIGNHEYEVPNELDEYALRFFGNAGFDGTRSYHRFESGGVWFFALNTEEPFGIDDPQGQWLVDGLAEVRQKPGFRFSIVSLHRPMLTCGDSGDLPEAFAEFDPVFAANDVLFVFAGHMHGYERFELGRDPTYITTAGGGGVIRDPSENTARPYCGSRVAVGDYYHSVVLHVTDDSVSGEVIDRAGAVRDTFSKSLSSAP